MNIECWCGWHGPEGKMHYPGSELQDPYERAENGPAHPCNPGVSCLRCQQVIPPNEDCPCQDEELNASFLAAQDHCPHGPAPCTCHEDWFASLTPAQRASLEAQNLQDEIEAAERAAGWDPNP